MSANVYECMFLLDANKVAGDVHAAQAQLHGILEKHSAEILASRPWDERRLAYPVNGHKKGLYYLTYFKIEGKKLVDIEQDVALNETILRSMVLRIDPKLVDTMLAIARDEHATALPSGTDTDGMDGGDDGHRRGRRPMDMDKD
jgi:small subunit ribosomal protein S6